MVCRPTDRAVTDSNFPATHLELSLFWFCDHLHCCQLQLSAVYKCTHYMSVWTLYEVHTMNAMWTERCVNSLNKAHMGTSIAIDCNFANLFTRSCTPQQRPLECALVRQSLVKVLELPVGGGVDLCCDQCGDSKGCTVNWTEYSEFQIKLNGNENSVDHKVRLNIDVNGQQCE